MIGEFLREVSALVIVFVPLDAVFNPSALSGSAVSAHCHLGSRSRIHWDSNRGVAPLMDPLVKAMLILAAVLAPVAALGFYWAKQEREEFRARMKRLDRLNPSERSNRSVRER